MTKSGVWKAFEQPKYRAMYNQRQKLEQLIFAAKSKATVAKYSLYWRKYQRWARKWDLKTEMPIQSTEVCLYIAEVADSCTSISSLNAHIYAIKWAHSVCGVEDPTKADTVVLAAEGARRSMAKASRVKLPFPTETVEKICSRFGADGSTLRELRFALMCALAFLGFFRISELLSLRLRDVSLQGNLVKIRITRSKTDVHGKGADVLINGRGSIDIGHILQMYIVQANIQDESDFLFRKIDVKGRLNPENKPMIYSRARFELRFYLQKLGLDPVLYGWHGFRHGGATAASKKGVSHRLIKQHGRWKSESAKNMYIHESQADFLSVTNAINP